MIKISHPGSVLKFHLSDWRAGAIPHFLGIILILFGLAACGRADTVSPVPAVDSESTPASPGETSTSNPTETIPPITAAIISPETPAPTPSSMAEITPTTEIPSIAFSPGDHALTTVYNGNERTYVLHIPPGLEATTPVPMVLAFHGLGLNAIEMNRISGLSTQADSSGFIVVYPEGTGDTKSWNGGHCCGTAARDRVDDAGFVRALIAELSASLPIDPKHIHATGFSNGAIFTYRLACELADMIASFGPVSATPIEEDMRTCSPARSVPIMHFHGTADEPNPYIDGKTAAGYQFMSVAETTDWWKEYNRCPAAPQTGESGSIRHDVYSPCTSGSDLELYTIDGGKHAWPGGEAVNLKMGLPNMEISATPLLWEFFQTHPMP